MHRLRAGSAAIALAALLTAAVVATPVAAQNPASQANQTSGCAPQAGRTIICVKPSDTDPAIQRYNRVNYATYNNGIGKDANLLVFLPGTGGVPPGPLDYLKEGADAGYRVISLDYNDTPSVAVYCPRQKPDCSERFRRMRLYGDITLSPQLDNTKPESIVNRLVKMLRYLDAKDPSAGWSQYLDGDQPKWGRIAFSGQSQGAGMSAFIAKHHVVARVILFSNPWDYVKLKDGTRQLASWIAEPSKTPVARWYGGYHEKERMAYLLARAFDELKMPKANIRVFTLPLPQRLANDTTGHNPYHPQGVHDPRYAPQRKFFLGKSP
jgi:hypothetical protein